MLPVNMFVKAPFVFEFVELVNKWIEPFWMKQTGVNLIL